jgi:hypothetical protein
VELFEVPGGLPVLISILKLAYYANTEHSQVNHWRTLGHHLVKVAWSSYDGAGVHVRHHHWLLELRHGKLRFV